MFIFLILLDSVTQSFDETTLMARQKGAPQVVYSPEKTDEEICLAPSESDEDQQMYSEEEEADN